MPKNVRLDDFIYVINMLRKIKILRIIKEIA